MLKLLFTLLLHWNTELQCISDVVYGEARGEPLLGQVAVADVIINRAIDKHRSLCEITKEPFQFVHGHGQAFKRISFIALWLNVFGYDAASGARYFHSGNPSREGKYKAHIGGHHFY